MLASEETTLWAAGGLRCVVRRYDDERYQLRLLRTAGTVKADLFTDYGQAVAFAELWPRQTSSSSVVFVNDGDHTRG
jgi:hypothetical protein